MGTRRNPSNLLVLIELTLISFAAAGRFSPADNYLVSCGAPSSSSSSSVALDDGRVFLPDSGESFSAGFRLHCHGHDASLSNPSPGAAAASPLYRSARVFSRPSSYEFEIGSAGTHLIRFHFYPFLTPEYNLSAARFHVFAAGHVLLSDFGTDVPVLKEYLIHAETGNLEIHFAPAEGPYFAFVNAIEVVSAPKDLVLYPARLVTRDGSTKFNGLAEQALETVHRINVGGPKVTPLNDTLWRTWLPEDGFAKLVAGTTTVHYGGRIKYQTGGASREVAPDYIYNTARVLENDGVPGSSQSMSWEFPVVSGYKYLIRMHFCDIASLTLNQLYFSVHINGYLAYENLDISRATDMLASPYYVDLIVDVGSSETLNISIVPSALKNPPKVRGLLNGLEIMKINNTLGSLGGSSSMVPQHSMKRGFGAFVRSLVCGLAFVSLFMIGFMLFLRWRDESRIRTAWSRLPTDVSLSRDNPIVSGSEQAHRFMDKLVGMIET